MKKIILSIEGMTCSACSSGLEKYLSKQEGIEAASVNLVLATATIAYDETHLTIKDLEKFIAEAGFKSKGIFTEKDIKKSNKRTKFKITSMTIFVIILLFFSISHMLNPKFLSNQTIVYLQFAFAILFLGFGLPIIKNGIKSLIHKTPNMNTLITIGAFTSFLYSIYNMILIIKGKEHSLSSIYFESVVIIIYFVYLGKYIEEKSKNKTKDAIAKLVTITPNHAIIKEKENEKVVTLDLIHKGDILICRPGEKIAVDGVITKGKAHLDESFITGESKAKEKKIGEKVVAGSINFDGYLEYEAEKIGKDSTISEIVRLVVDALNTKAPISRIADKVASIFVPVVIGIAVISFIINLILSKDISQAITAFVTVLVVACPCSLGLATPLAMIVSEGLCINNGILVKKTEILETAKDIDTIVFDKTGTLTYGKQKIAKIYNYTRLTDKIIMQIAGTMESTSSHPIATAFKDYIEEKRIRLLSIKETKEYSGMGISGIIEGNKYYVGNRNLIKKMKIKNTHQEDEKLLSENGNGIIYVANEKEILALIGVNDILRKEASKVIKKLNENGIETIMLSGDHKRTAEIIAKKLGITQVIAEVLPKEKTKVIEELKENHKVLMCGDGINDSPSLASADIGVSVNDGTDIAMDASDVILMKNDLNCILNLRQISKKTIHFIKQNLFWAFFYNALMIPVAAGALQSLGIHINPMIASIAMVCSSMTVILNTLRLKRIKLEKE